ncbi:ABC transporter permease [Treponema ruminis]|uniref:Peptide/nickel transport system permease protein n=1 Tax=Treponema ruminis TaxID=744515 RepID=A0A7W8G9C9_9SPIR|nr:ABC transporter permease [Treponema ruminis]MBB5226273.1 peptide/nickel transport system permease protein [Treponema ruminis]
MRSEELGVTEDAHMEVGKSKLTARIFRPFYGLKILVRTWRSKFPLLSFITSRIITMLVILFILGWALFALMALAPGDIVDQMMQQQLMSQTESRGAGGANKDNVFSEEQVAKMRAEMGLDKPFTVQYFMWLERVIVHHDLGVSLISKAPVSFLIKSRIVNSLVLNLISLVFITIFSFLLGVYFSSKAGTRIDLAATFFALFFHAFPGILLLILLQLFASVSGLFPVTAYPDFPIGEAPAKFVFSYTYHIFLPLFASFLGGIGGTMRMIRSTMLDQMGMPYIMALRARGISERRVYLNHAFRNTLNPYITGSANLLAGLFSGSLVLEIIFSYPGIGRLMYDAVMQQDVNLVLANNMFISALVLAGMTISDILLAVVDPRIRYGKEG